MHDHHWKQEVFTLPNLLSLIRLLLIPVYCRIYLQAGQWQDYALAGLILALSCVTDWFDGMIARKTNAVSTVGKILDPVADKATQFAVTICLVKENPILKWLLILFFVKEGLQALLAMVYFGCGMMLPGAVPAGKVCTTVYFLSLILLVLLPDLSDVTVHWIAALDGGFLTLSLGAYVAAYFGCRTKLEKWRK
jgi:cardiolipin synthase